MLELAKNNTPDYGNLEHGKRSATVKAEGNVEITTPNVPNKTEEPKATPWTTRENAEVIKAETTKRPKSTPASNENNDQLKNVDERCTSCEFPTTSTKLRASHIVRNHCKGNWTIKMERTPLETKVTMMGTQNEPHTTLGAIPKQPRDNPEEKKVTDTNNNDITKSTGPPTDNTEEYRTLSNMIATMTETNEPNTFVTTMKIARTEAT